MGGLYTALSILFIGLFGNQVLKQFHRALAIEILKKKRLDLNSDVDVDINDTKWYKRMFSSVCCCCLWLQKKYEGEKIDEKNLEAIIEKVKERFSYEYIYNMSDRLDRLEKKKGKKEDIDQYNDIKSKYANSGINTNI